MCSIMGFCGSGVTFARFKECFDRTVSRGPDDTRYVDTGRGLLGFHRLAIMGLHPEAMNCGREMKFIRQLPRMNAAGLLTSPL